MGNFKCSNYRVPLQSFSWPRCLRVLTSKNQLIPSSKFACLLQVSSLPTCQQSVSHLSHGVRLTKKLAKQNRAEAWDKPHLGPKAWQAPRFARFRTSVSQKVKHPADQHGTPNAIMSREICYWGTPLCGPFQGGGSKLQQSEARRFAIESSAGWGAPCCFFSFPKWTGPGNGRPQVGF